LANTKSAKKRIRQTARRTERNRTARSRARTYVKNARSTMESGTPDEAAKGVKLAASELDKAASKGVIHRKNAARRKSRLMKHLAQAKK
jgi:small subunit ribosomal protein S20